MKYRIRHRTRFRYEAPVRFARCNLRLRPIDYPGQSLDAFDIEVTPHAAIEPTVGGGYPVAVARMLVDRPSRELIVESRSTIRVDRPLPVEAPGDPDLVAVADAARASHDLGPYGPANYLFTSPRIPCDPAITAWVARELVPGRGLLDAGLALARTIKAEFRYDGTATEANTPPSDAFAKRHGVCQDFAQVMIAGARGLGIPAAYVSGYLRTIPPPGRKRLVGADATHAWVLLWCGPQRGWIGFDPTNGCLMGEDHIVAAVGRDYADVTPIDGIFLGRDGQKIDVEVDVEPLEEDEQGRLSLG